jgi:hypothetical protein
MSEVKVPGNKPAPPESAVSSGTATPTKKLLYQKGVVPPEAKKIIKDNMKQVLNKLGNITEVIVEKNNEMKGTDKDTTNLVRSLDEAHVVLDKLSKHP